MSRLSVEDVAVLTSTAARARATASTLQDIMRVGANAAEQAVTEAQGVVDSLARTVERIRRIEFDASDERASSAARSRLQAAERRLAEGHRLSRMVRAEAREVTDRHASFTHKQRALVEGLVQAQTMIAHDIERARGILRSAAGATSGGSGPSVSSVPSGPPVLGQTQLRCVNLQEVADPIAHVNGPADFHKMSMSDMQVALNLLESRVLPAVMSGAETEQMERLDAALGFTERTVNCQRTYELFFQSDEIVLSRSPDGTFSVTNGGHRVWLARRMGITHLPARITGESGA